MDASVRPFLFLAWPGLISASAAQHSINFLRGRMTNFDLRRHLSPFLPFFPAHRLTIFLGDRIQERLFREHEVEYLTKEVKMMLLRTKGGHAAL